MKLRLWHTNGWSGNPLDKDQFAYVLPSISKTQTAIVFHCRGNPRRPRICQIPIVLGPPTDKHGWDGNLESPTITPSIGCDQRCGWHGNIVNGDWQP